MLKDQLFITFEGLDGSGKSSLFEIIGPILREKSRPPLRLVDKKYPPNFSPYTDSHIACIRSILWEYPSGAPMGELGDMHWLHLLASWFHVIDNTQIKPALAQGDSIFMESWCYKYLVRYRLKSDYMYKAMLTALQSLTQPNPVVFIDIKPEVAAERKKVFGYSESGGMDGLRGSSKKDFIAYQNTLRDIYLDLAAQHQWIVIEADNKPLFIIADEVLERLTSHGI